MEIRAGGGWGGKVLELGYLDEQGVVAVWEIQSEGGGVKNACHPSGVCVFSLE